MSRFRQKRDRWSAAILSCGILLLSSGTVLAQSETNFTWSGAGGDGLWSNTNNWLWSVDDEMVVPPYVPNGDWDRVTFGNAAGNDARVVSVDFSLELCRLYINATTGSVGYVFNSVNGGMITFRNGDSTLRSKISDSAATITNTIFNVSVSFPTSNSRMHKAANGHEFIFNYPVFNTVQLNLASTYRFRDTTQNFSLNQVGLTVILDPPASRTNTYTGTISGSGILMLKEGAGITVFSSSAKTYSAPTVIREGRFYSNTTVTNSSSFTVEAGGWLAGTGNISATTVEQGGVLGAGGLTGVGALTVQGLTLEEGARLEFRLAAPGDPHDVLTVQGDLTLDGYLDLLDTGGMDLGTYTLMTYTGDLTDLGLQTGNVPGGFAYQIDTATAGEINLHVIPEPASWTLLGLALLGLARRRHLRATPHPGRK